MKKFAQPSKQKVRDWLKHRRLKNDPPPDIEQIQHELGWRSIEPVLEADKTRSQGLVASHILNFA